MSLSKKTKWDGKQQRIKGSQNKKYIKGTLKMDATVAPQHIGYPVDTRLLHEARQYSNALIDKLFHGHSLWENMPRAYRQKAHIEDLAFAKKSNLRKQAIKRAREYSQNRYSYC